MAAKRKKPETGRAPTEKQLHAAPAPIRWEVVFYGKSYWADAGSVKMAMQLEVAAAAMNKPAFKSYLERYEINMILYETADGNTLVELAKPGEVLGNWLD